MKKPDLLVFLGMIILLGAAVTGMTVDNTQKPTQLVSEHTIR